MVTSSRVLQLNRPTEHLPYARHCVRCCGDEDEGDSVLVHRELTDQQETENKMGMCTKSLRAWGSPSADGIIFEQERERLNCALKGA